MAAEQLRPADTATAAAAPATWRVDSDTAWTRTADDDAVVMGMAEGIPLRLSATGSLVWEVLVEGRTPAEDIAAPPLTPWTEEDLVAEVARAAGMAPESIAPDVSAFLALLEQHGVVARA